MYHTIVVEGIDKTGKDTLVNYLFNLDNGKYLHHSRGIMSCIAYNKLYNRNVEYDLQQHTHEIFVYLTCEKQDWKVRCKLTNEPKINYEDNLNIFNEAKKLLMSNGIIILEYNTSYLTPYQIATHVLRTMEDLNNENRNR